MQWQIAQAAAVDTGAPTDDGEAADGEVEEVTEMEEPEPDGKADESVVVPKKRRAEGGADATNGQDVASKCANLQA